MLDHAHPHVEHWVCMMALSIDDGINLFMRSRSFS